MAEKKTVKKVETPAAEARGAFHRSRSSDGNPDQDGFPALGFLPADRAARRVLDRGRAERGHDLRQFARGGGEGARRLEEGLRARRQDLPLLFER